MLLHDGGQCVLLCKARYVKWTFRLVALVVSCVALSVSSAHLFNPYIGIGLEVLVWSMCVVLIRLSLPSVLALYTVCCSLLTSFVKEKEE